MEKIEIIEQIIEQLQKSPTHNDEVMFCDTGNVKLRYFVNAMQLDQFIPGNDTRAIEYKVKARLTLKNGKKEIIESVSEIELLEILDELKKYNEKK